MPRLQPTGTIAGSGRLVRVEAVTASSGDGDGGGSTTRRGGDRGGIAGSIGTTDGWSAPAMPLLLLAGLAVLSFAVTATRRGGIPYAPTSDGAAPQPAAMPERRTRASERPSPQTASNGDTEAVDSSLGSMAPDVSPGDKVAGSGPPVASATAGAATAKPSAAPVHDDAHGAADGPSAETAQPPVVTYTVRRRRGGLVGAARKGLGVLRARL
jgi:hypothetical protein